MKVASSSELGRLRATPAPRIKAGRLDDDNDDDDECGTQNRKDVRVFSMSFYLDFVIALQKPFVSLSVRLSLFTITHENQIEQNTIVRSIRNKPPATNYTSVYENAYLVKQT